MSVDPDQMHVSKGNTDVLSGGETSISLLCFVVSLWQTMESPFCCLDEFDRCMVRLDLDRIYLNLRKYFIRTPDILYRTPEILNKNPGNTL